MRWIVALVAYDAVMVAALLLLVDLIGMGPSCAIGFGLGLLGPLAADVLAGD